MINVYFGLMFAGTFFTAVSQVLLKQSANRTWKNPLQEYLNWRVILSYFIFFCVLLVNTYAFTKVEMKYGTVIDAFSYVFVMILSYVILRERFTKGRVIGNMIIIAGILIYTS